MSSTSKVGYVRYDASQGRWDWMVHDIPILVGMRSYIVVEGQDGYRMMSHVVESFEDRVGRGDRRGGQAIRIIWMVFLFTTETPRTQRGFLWALRSLCLCGAR